MPDSSLTLKNKPAKQTECSQYLPSMDPVLQEKTYHNLKHAEHKSRTREVNFMIPKTTSSIPQS